MAEAYIIDACRTPRGIGKAGRGALAHLHPQRVAMHVLKALKDRNDLDTSEIDDVIWSTSNQSGQQGHDLGRMAALDAGYDVRASGVTIARFCGGGISSVNMAAASIMAGVEDCIIAGGSEMMSYVATLPSTGPRMMDVGNLHLRDQHPQSSQGVCADAIAGMEGISREACDDLALLSQANADAAIRDGRFECALVPVFNEDGTLALDHEEFPRPQTTREGLASLKASFAELQNTDVDGKGTTYKSLIQRKYPGLEWEPIHHAGNSSGVVDGAAGVLLASKSYADRRGWKPRARIVTYANVGDCPTLMLNAPVPAIQKVLDRAGLNVADIDLWEINEAFAVVTEKAIRDLEIPRDRVNVNGGAMALGHPIGGTGSILIGTIVDELERRGAKRGLITMCAAGGMAPAIIVERI